MLPTFLNFNGGVAGAPVQVPPPPRFRPLLGPVEWVTDGGSTASSKGTSASQKAGLRYEEKVGAELSKRFGDLVSLQTRLNYKDDGGVSYCIPDAIIHTRSTIVVAEIKLQHMPESWHQLCKYKRLLEHWGGRYGRDILRLEICRSLDASMPYPEAYRVVESIDDFIIHSKECDLGILQWKL